MPARPSSIPRLFDGAPDGRLLAQPPVRQGGRGRAALRRPHGRAVAPCRHALRRSARRRCRSPTAPPDGDDGRAPATSSRYRPARRFSPSSPRRSSMAASVPIPDLRTIRWRLPASPSFCRPAAPSAPSARRWSKSSAARRRSCPTIRPIGDVDEEDHLLDASVEAGADRLALPPAIGRLARQLALDRADARLGPRRPPRPARARPGRAAAHPRLRRRRRPACRATLPG